VLAGAALVLLAAAGRLPEGLRFWPTMAFAIAFAIAEATQLHTEFRQETFSFSLSELPLVVGLFELGPRELVLARLIGASSVFLQRSTPPHKAAFNLSLFAAETATAAVLFTHLLPTQRLLPVDWVSAYFCVAAAEVASTLAVIVGMSVLGATPSWRGLRTITGSVLVAGTLNTALALVVVIMVRRDATAIVLLIIIGATTVAAYRAHSRLLSKHTSLGQLYDLSSDLSASAPYDELVAVLLDRCRSVLRAERVVIRNPSEADVDVQVLNVMTTGQPVVLPRWSREPTVRDWLLRRQLRDAVLAPLRDGETVISVLQVENRLGEMSTFTADDVRMLETVAAHAEAALRGSRLLAQLRHDACHDTLTGLGNRSFLFRRVEELLDRQAMGTVLLLDLDRFKEVNDSLGHRIGDLLLREVAARCVGVLPADATVARLGGDEFAALLPSCSVAEDAQRLALDVRRALGTPFEVAKTTLEVSASIGVVLLPAHGSDPVTLLQHADVAMYAAKGATAGVCLYSSDDDAANLRRLSLSRELRHGIEAGELVVHYQPKVALGTGELTGVEALVRWDHAKRGRIMPDEFIPVAEQTGLIGLLTQEVLRTALTQVRSWLDAGSRVGVAVNLSARGLLEPGLCRQVAGQLATAGVPAELLTFEITESSLMGDFDHAVEVLHELVGQGISLSLDDFGTGYSSLTYLQRLPVQEVKIDKSFVLSMNTDPTDRAIVRAVIELAHTLGMVVVAEGVEDEATLRGLLGMSCDVMQGYLVSRPLPADQATEWLQNTTGRIPEQIGPPGGARRLRIIG